MEIDPKDVSTARFHEYLLASVAPRPIAWASTISRDGQVNLSPFSFFNVFGSHPPILIFSPSRRVRDNTTKHTLENVRETMECVINIANYELAGQMVLTSAEYAKEINEFQKAGLSMAPSVKVGPPRVAEAPASFECKVRHLIPIGHEGGGANLIICEVVFLHIREDMLDENGRIDPHRFDNIARMGKAWYTRAAKGLYEMHNPTTHDTLGFEDIPEEIRASTHFTPTELSMLAQAPHKPSAEEVEMVKHSTGFKDIHERYGEDTVQFKSKIYALAKELIGEGKIEEAWRVLLAV